MDKATESIGTFLGYFFKIVFTILLGIIYLPAFFIVNSFTKKWEEMLKEFGF